MNRYAYITLSSLSDKLGEYEVEDMDIQVRHTMGEAVHPSAHAGL